MTRRGSHPIARRLLRRRRQRRRNAEAMVTLVRLLPELGREP